MEDIRTALHKKVDVLDINQLKDNFELTQEILRDGVKYMDNVKNDAYYVKRLKQDLEFVVTHMKMLILKNLMQMKSFLIPCYFVWFKYLRMQKIVRWI